MVWSLKELQKIGGIQTCIDGQWMPARPENWRYRSLRKKLEEAWMVFTGKAEAFTWPGGQ